ncbi:hypothetical protein [Anaerovorax sp. IOR16]|uniref:hypothetical protein n=1 Tax=Anaerovorax sp. IOR16 TaxID=2773458 RepID=UPI0019D21E87|nr:hypothetical protein [Anaerovorax sp. IOR16]
MGDGRYYTYYQFFSIIILVFLSMFSVGSMVISYFRNKGKKYIFFIFLSIIHIAIFRVIECVIPNMEIAFSLRYLQLSMVIILNWILLYCLYVKVLMVFRFPYKLFRWIMTLAFITLLVLGILTKGRLLIISYVFLFAQYSRFYIIVLSIVLCMEIVAMVFTFKHKESIHSVYKNTIISFIILGTLVIPLIGYFLAILFHYSYLDFVELLIFFMFSIILNISMYSETEFGLTTLAFNKIGDMIGDYIFVTNGFGNIIYKNKSVLNSDLFIKEEMININNITDIYEGNIELKESYLGKEYIQFTKGNDIFYFVHKNKTLMNNGEIIGFIFTISDITPLMDLVMSLEDQKEKSKKANKKLENYSKVVYHLEKEKEINILLDEIIRSKESDMENLIFMIDNLQKETDDKDFDNYVDRVIEYNRNILEDVRQAVNTYWQHYGG